MDPVEDAWAWTFRPGAALARRGGIVLLALLAGACASTDRGQPGTRIDLADRAALRAARPLIIAHRGGVVGPDSPENSLRAIRRAARDGYHLVEIDIRRTQDDQPVLFHDATLRRACGRDGTIADLPFEEAVSLVYLGTDQRVASLDAALALCRELSLGVMLDIKAERVTEPFVARIAALLDRHELRGAAMTISRDPLVLRGLGDRVMTLVDDADVQRLARGEGPDLGGRFWFGLPPDVTPTMIGQLQQHGALVIPAINTFRYPPGQDMPLARRDVQRLLAEGADGFQIDSVYRPMLEQLAADARR